MTVQMSFLHARGISDLPMGNVPGLQQLFLRGSESHLQPTCNNGHSLAAGTALQGPLDATTPERKG